MNASVKVGNHSLRGMWWIEGPLEAALSGLQERSFWPARRDLQTMLDYTGWTRQKLISYAPDFTNGPLACLWAERLPPRLGDRFRRAATLFRP